MCRRRASAGPLPAELARLLLDRTRWESRCGVDVVCACFHCRVLLLLSASLSYGRTTNDSIHCAICDQPKARQSLNSLPYALVQATHFKHPIKPLMLDSHHPSLQAGLQDNLHRVDRRRPPTRVLHAELFAVVLQTALASLITISALFWPVGHGAVGATPCASYRADYFSTLCCHCCRLCFNFCFTLCFCLAFSSSSSSSSSYCCYCCCCCPLQPRWHYIQFRNNACIMQNSTVPAPQPLPMRGGAANSTSRLQKSVMWSLCSGGAALRGVRLSYPPAITTLRSRVWPAPAWRRITARAAPTCAVPSQHQPPAWPLSGMNIW